MEAAWTAIVIIGHIIGWFLLLFGGCLLTHCIQQKRAGVRYPMAEEEWYTAVASLLAGVFFVSCAFGV